MSHLQKNRMRRVKGMSRRIRGEPNNNEVKEAEGQLSREQGCPRLQALVTAWLRLLGYCP